MKHAQVLVSVIGLALAARAQAEEHVSPIVAAARHAKFVDAKISPKGTYLAVIGQERGKRTLMFIDLKTRKFASVLRPDAMDMVGDFEWVNDQRVVAEIVSQTGSLAAPVNRGELYAVDADGRNGRMIFGYRAGEAQLTPMGNGGRQDFGSAWLIDPLRRDGKHVLVGAYTWGDNPDGVGVIVYRLDVDTGVKTVVTHVPMTGAVPAIMTDAAGDPRVAVTSDVDLHPHVFYREPGADWKELAGLKWLTKESVPYSFDARERIMFVSDVAPDGYGLYSVNIDSGERKLLASNKVPPSFIVRGGAEAPGRVVAVEFEPDLPTYTFVEPEHPTARLIRALEAAFPDQRVRITSRTSDNRLVIARVSSDRDPGRFYLIDLEKHGTEPIVEVRPWVDSDQSAPMSAFHIAASDGLRIHGFFTMPPNLKAGAPLVVLVHGGPHGVRDVWGANPEVQLLASQGFAVLQVNYRGSGGYGEAYQEAGYRHWGDRVVQDIVDATRWMVAKGMADDKRVCIYGASFGGYAALQATILAPDLFRCAVGYAGVYDLALMDKVGDIPETRLGRAYVHVVVGDDKAALRSVSPVHNAEKIKARVLLIHGDTDRRVPIEHAEALRDAMTAKGNPPEWLVESDEGHGFYDEGARQKMYTKLVAFLKANTKPVDH